MMFLKVKICSVISLGSSSGWDGRGLAMAAYKQAVFKRSLNKHLAGSVVCKQLVDKITGVS